MNRALINAHVQAKVIEGAGNVPTVPTPDTLTPLDDGWNDDTDILIGQWAYNPDQDAVNGGTWYYRHPALGIRVWTGSGGVSIPFQSAAIYVSKAGSDLSAGTNVSIPVLTISEAITKAADLLTAGADAVKILVQDGGTYTEDITLVENMHLEMPAGILVGTIALASGASVRLNKHFAGSTNDTMVQKTGGSGHGFYYSNVTDGRGVSGALTGVQCFRNVSNGSVLFAKPGVTYVPADGVGVGDSAAGFGHIHFWSPDLYLAGNNAVGISAESNSTDLIGYIDHILEIGSPTGTQGIVVSGNSAIVKTTATEIIADEVYNVSDGDLYLVSAKVTGTRTWTGGNVYESISNLRKRFSTLVDGASVAFDAENAQEHHALLDTAESAVQITLSNAEARTPHVIDMKKTIAGDSTFTFTGTGYKFVDMDNKAAPAASLALDAFSGDANTTWEIHLYVTSRTDGGDMVVNVKAI